ncbi:unnamed protein product [Laminaria digitata]
MAARTGKVEIVRLLLTKHRANPDATDNTDRTPLFCGSQHDSNAEIVQLLLEAGADPALAEERGCIPLHLVAQSGHMELVDMLYSWAPTTLNRCLHTGHTPLALACYYGHERVASRLLSLGAMQLRPPDERNPSLLEMTVTQEFVNVVRVLINEGIRAIGGKMATLPNALGIACCAPPGENPPAAARGGRRGEAVGVGQH